MEPINTTLSFTSRGRDPIHYQSQALPNRAPLSAPGTPKPVADLLSAAISEVQIDLSDHAALSKGAHNSRSPQGSKPLPKTSSAKTPCSSSLGRSRSPSHGSRKRPHHNSSHASPRVSPRESRSKRSRHYPRRESSRSPSSSLHHEFKEFRRFRDQQRERGTIATLA